MPEFRVIKTYDHNEGLSCAFRQWRAPSHCRHIHGYALAFDIEFAANQICEKNWVIDFGGLKPLKANIKSTFDHMFAVAADDPAKETFLELMRADLANVIVLDDVGCEKFAEYVMQLTNDVLQSDFADDIEERGLRVVSVTCREHNANAAKIIA